MFQHITPAPPDPILGLSEAFRAEPNPAKINLAVGVYKDASGATPVLDSVKAAERRLVETQTTKGYLSIEGSPDYAKQVQRLMFGPDHPIVRDARARTANTPGGTGALRVAADYLHQNHQGAGVWLSDPTWANHHGIFGAAGVSVTTYDYLDPATNSLNIDGMLNAIAAMEPGEVILLHGCCHNPTGVDPSPDQWQQIAAAVAKQGVLPLLDFAYQGFGDGLDEDALGLRAIAEHCEEFLVCSSFSKNFGLYRDRVGALTAVAKTSDTADAVMSQIKQAIRRNYSNPPAHGSEVVTTILADDALRSQWQAELDAMRSRINTMRHTFADALDAAGVSLAPDGNGFVRAQRGMFTMSGLSKDQVAKLRENHAIYIVGSGRINVAGMSEQNIPILCSAIQDTLQNT